MNKNIFLPIILSLIFVTLIGSIYLYYQKQPSSAPISSNKEYKEYSDSEYGIYFKYPSDWLISTEGYFCPHSARCIYLDPTKIINDPNEIVFKKKTASLLEIIKYPIKNCQFSTDKSQKIINKNITAYQGEPDNFLYLSDCHTRLIIDQSKTQVYNQEYNYILDSLTLSLPTIKTISKEEASNIYLQLLEIKKEMSYLKNKNIQYTIEVIEPTIDTDNFFRFNLVKKLDKQNSVPTVFFYIDPISGKILVEDPHGGEGLSTISYEEWQKKCYLDYCQSDISTWKTYRNDKYGFEFKYPTNLVTTEYQDWMYDAIRIDLGSTQLFSIVQITDTNKTAKEYASEIHSPIKTEIIGGKNAYYFEESNNKTVKQIFLDLNKNTILRINIFENNPTVNQILSTFKIL